MFDRRVLVVPSFLLVALGAVACGSADEAPETKAEGAVVAAPPVESAYPPGAMPALPPPSLPPLPQDPTLTSGPEVDDGGTPAPTPSPAPPTPNPNPTPNPTPTTCTGGEAEVEPNTAASPNVLNGGRCGVLAVGDTEDVLLLNSQSFKLKWSGFVNVNLEASGAGYLVKITSQTPGVATPWTLNVE